MEISAAKEKFILVERPFHWVLFSVSLRQTERLSSSLHFRTGSVVIKNLCNHSK